MRRSESLALAGVRKFALVLSSVRRGFLDRTRKSYQRIVQGLHVYGGILGRSLIAEEKSGNTLLDRFSRWSASIDYKSHILRRKILEIGRGSS